jgi:hypothetical protein
LGHNNKLLKGREGGEGGTSSKKVRKKVQKSSKKSLKKVFNSRYPRKMGSPYQKKSNFWTKFFLQPPETQKTKNRNKKNCLTKLCARAPSTQRANIGGQGEIGTPALWDVTIFQKLIPNDSPGPIT